MCRWAKRREQENEVQQAIQTSQQSSTARPYRQGGDLGHGRCRRGYQRDAKEPMQQALESSMKGNDETA